MPKPSPSADASLDLLPRVRPDGGDGTPLVYREEGSGPPVVLLHGFPDTLDSWLEIQPRLAAAGHRTLALQLPGYPPSGPLPNYGSAPVARALAAAIAALAQEPVHVVGYDWGAVAGYGLAALCPERLRSLTAIGVPHPRFTPRTLGLAYRARHMLRFQSVGLARRALLRPDGRYIETLYRRWSPAWRDPSRDVARARRLLATREAVDATTAYYRDMARGPSVREGLRLHARPIDVPSLVLAGAVDGCFHLPEYAPQRAHFTGPYAFHAVAGGGHFLHREQPDAVLARVLPFLQAH